MVEAVVLPTVPFWQVVEASPSHLAHVDEQNVLAEAGPTSFFGAEGQAEKCKKVEDPLDWALVDHQAAVLAEVAALVIVVVVVTWHCNRKKLVNQFFREIKKIIFIPRTLHHLLDLTLLLSYTVYITLEVVEAVVHGVDVT